MTHFLTKRPRRLRSHEVIRRLVRETELRPQNLIMPFFVVEGSGVRKPIASMPGIAQVSVDVLVEEAKRIAEFNIGGVILFGIPSRKDAKASQAYADDGIVQQALRELTERVPKLLRMSDVCLCEYMDHGHCGVVEKGQIKNDATLEILAATAVSQVRAGTQMVAPSDMMDGRVRSIRQALDAQHFEDTPILAYSVKYASSFYGPFREAAQSTPHFGDRRSYQMDFANSREALREARLDVEEGADILMVKPAGYYLDILSLLRENFDVPLTAYQVSGEYSMIKAAAQNQWIDEDAAILESLTAIRRAGAQIIVTYFAPQAAQLLQEKKR